MFQKYCPPKRQTIPSGMNCLYCCQFCIVITVPGAIESVAAPSGLTIWAPEEVEAAPAGEVALPFAFMGALFTWAIALVEPIKIPDQNVRQPTIFESCLPIF